MLRNGKGQFSMYNRKVSRRWVHRTEMSRYIGDWNIRKHPRDELSELDEQTNGLPPTSDALISVSSSSCLTFTDLGEYGNMLIRHIVID